jgi:uncharacterized cupin superfamily protein
MTMPDPKPLWTAAEIEAAPEAHIRHPWNANSDVRVKPLSAAAGLSRVVLSLARVPPGKESFVYHSHERDEEFLFILSGRGRAEIGEEVFEVGPGDFMGFTAPGAAHHLTNPYEEDLVYLMGGERSGLDIGHFPRLKRRIVYSRTGINAVEDSALQPMAMEDFIVKP